MYHNKHLTFLVSCIKCDKWHLDICPAEEIPSAMMTCWPSLFTPPCSFSPHAQIWVQSKILFKKIKPSIQGNFFRLRRREDREEDKEEEEEQRAGPHTGSFLILLINSQTCLSYTLKQAWIWKIFKIPLIFYIKFRLRALYLNDPRMFTDHTFYNLP